MRLGIRRAAGGVGLVLVLALLRAMAPASALARPGAHTLRVEGAVAVFVSDPQSSRFGPGGGFGLSYELRPIPWLGIEARYGALFFSTGTESEIGGYHAPGLGLRIHPIELDVGDLWIGASGDVVITGAVVRAGISAGLGFEFEAAWFARVGPFVRFHDVVQPDDDALGPEDAAFLTFGVSGAFLGEEPRTEPEPVAEIPDTDRDGLRDPDDACPAEPEDADGFEDDDGCPDRDDDSDGVLDPDDGCRLEPEDRDEHEDADGCPDRDDDADGVLDVDDGCRLEPEDADGFEDADGCPDPDDDRDGILDPDDRCRTSPETRNGYQDDDGCPDEVEREIAEVAVRIFFDTNRARIPAPARRALADVVRILTEHPEITLVRIDGHTDTRGSPEFNLDLSHRRATAVRAQLIAQGVSPDRLVVAGHGEARLEVVGEAEEHHAANRRVVFTVMAIDGRTVRTE